MVRPNIRSPPVTGSSALPSGLKRKSVWPIVTGWTSFGPVMTRRAVAKNPLLAPLCNLPKRGESGLEVSDFLPEIARQADKLCVLRSCHGDSVNQTRGAFFDVMNRNFVRRLHHHAMTAHEQGMFLIDKHGVIRNVTVVGPIDPVPGGAELAELARARCGATPVPA